MKRLNYLKNIRVLLAILFFIPVLLLFIDFAHIIPISTHSIVHIQIIPAILGGMWGIVVLQLLLAFVFGRIYCSTICPAGILQDVMNRLFCIGKKKKKGIRRFRHHKPKNALRYSLLGLIAIGGMAGFMPLVLLFDPYSNFGRIAANLFRPLVMWGNNILVKGLSLVDNNTLYNVTVSTVTTAALVSALIIFIVLIVMSFRGRLFCNTICPVGSLLGIISKYSLFKISFDKDACTYCGNCEHSCKAEAIDSEHLTVDTSRCVDCFNCISSCSKGGLKYRFMPKDKKEEKLTVSRRNFITAGITVAASLPLVDALANGIRQRRRKGSLAKETIPITPPGSISLEHFKDKCTGCHLCVTHCPSQVLKPAGLEYGLGYLLKPEVSYSNSYCNYECTVCSEICPNHAIKPLTKEEKATTQVGVVHFYRGRCIVHSEETDCGACSEHCPTQAVRMVPYKGTLTIPEINPDLCIGCGGCESICPVRPRRAIVVIPNETHKLVEKPKQEEVKDIKVDDFGF